MVPPSKHTWYDATFTPWRNASLSCLPHRVTAITVASEAMWREPLKWNAAAQAAMLVWEAERWQNTSTPKPERPRVLCSGLAGMFTGLRSDKLYTAAGDRLTQSYQGDVWDTYDATVIAWEDYSDKQGYRLLTMDDARARLCRLIDATPYLDWLLPVSNPQTIPVGAGRSNTWIGVCVINQKQANSHVPRLFTVSTPFRFLHLARFSGPLDLSRWLWIRWQCGGCLGYFSGAYQEICPDCGKQAYWSGGHAFNGRGRPQSDALHQGGQGIDRVIICYRTGPRVQAAHAEHVLDVVRQCTEAGVPYFVYHRGHSAADAPVDTRILPLLNGGP